MLQQFRQILDDQIGLPFLREVGEMAADAAFILTVLNVAAVNPSLSIREKLGVLIPEVLGS
jgi:hypothetical protein